MSIGVVPTEVHRRTEDGDADASRRSRRLRRPRASTSGRRSWAGRGAKDPGGEGGHQPFPPEPPRKSEGPDHDRNIPNPIPHQPAGAPLRARRIGACGPLHGRVPRCSEPAPGSPGLPPSRGRSSPASRPPCGRASATATGRPSGATNFPRTERRRSTGRPGPEPQWAPRLSTSSARIEWRFEKRPDIAGVPRPGKHLIIGNYIVD